LGAATLLLMLGVIITSIATTLQSIGPSRLQRQMTLGEWQATLKSLSASGGSGAAVDSVIRASGVASAPTVDTSAFVQLSAAVDPAGVDPTFVWSAIRDVPRGLSAAERATLDTAARFPAVEAFRRAAISSPPSSLWYLGNAGFSADSVAAVGRRSARFSRLALRNAAAAVLALDGHDKAGAVHRAREIVSVGRGLMHEPLPPLYERGVAIVGIGARLLSEVGLVTRDVDLVREAEEITRVTAVRNRAFALFNRFQLGRLAARSEDSAFSLAAADHRLLPVDRWALASAIVAGACWNPAELRAGIAPERFLSLERAARGMSDLPRSSDWAAAQRATLVNLDAATPMADAKDNVLLSKVKPLGRTMICGQLR
jgi:hypothetical protein